LVDGPDATAVDRLADAGRFDEIVEAWTSRHTVAEVDRRMHELGIPAGPVRSPVEALEVAAAERPGAVVSRTPAGEAVPQFPALFSSERIPRRPAPDRPVPDPLVPAPEAIS
jgi:crotonobetainyl-CoA:carnitine CoA-transferase CaiB-like acyl-CoA transferase